MKVENSVDVEFAASIAANVAANPVVGTNTTEDLTLTVNRREYVVVGDDTYISRTTDTPQWLVTLIESLTALQLDAAFADVADLRNALDTAIAAMNVAKNEYAMAIINYSDLEQIVNAKIETLNSTLREADATIIDVLSTRVTADQASALAVQSIAASMAGGSIKAVIDTIKSSVVTETQSRAIAIDGVRAELYGLADTVGITAGAVQVLESSVSLVDGPIKSALVDIQGSVTALEAQIDGVVETTTGTYEPLDLATGTLVLWQDAPTNTVKTLYKEWLDALTLDAHIGDTYVLVQTVEGVDTYAKSWKFQKGSVGANNTDANGYGWFPVTNSTAIEALVKAVEAKDLADGKRRVFTITPYPPYDQGDLWVQGTSGDLMRCQTAKASTGLYSASDWVKATKYTDDTALDMFVSDTFTSTLTEINTQLDQKAVAYYAPNMPHGEVALAAESAEYNGYVSDLWYKTVDDFKTYIYTKTHNIAVVEDSGTVLEAVATAEINGMLVDAITTYEDSGSIVGIGGTYDGQYYYQWLETPLPKYLFDKIDGKKTIYTAQPSSYDINDLWIPQTAVVGFVTKEIYVATRTSAIFVASDWIVASNYSAQIEAVDIRLTQTEIDTAILDGKITDEEEARIAAVLAEQQARLDAIAERVDADNMLDGKVTAEELARANAIDAVSAAYKEYSRIVTLAIADGVLTEDEQTLITSAAAAVEAAKQRFEDIEKGVVSIIDGTTAINLALATIDGTTNLLTHLNAELDKKVVVFSGEDVDSQLGMSEGDIYIETTTETSDGGRSVSVTKTYKYTTNAWVAISNNAGLLALADKTDGKRTVYSGSELPVAATGNPLQVNDLFIPTADFTVSTITYIANEMYRYNGTGWAKATRYDTIQAALSAQIIDSKIETFYSATIPVGMAASNTGDYWYATQDVIGTGTAINPQYSAGLIYKYNHTGATWTLTADISKGAFDLADGKRTIFGNAYNSVPTAVTNDLWIPSSTGGAYVAGKVYKYSGSSWVEVDYTNDEVVNGIINGSTPLDPSVITIGDTSTTFLEYVQSEIDKKVAIYSGESAPVAGQPIGVATNDIYLWFTTASKELANGTTQVYDITRTYKYSGSAWVEITTDSNITTLADLADGKRTVFSGNTVPTGATERDIWIPSADVNITTSGMCTVAGGTWNGTVCSITKYLKGEIYQYLASKWALATKYTENLDLFVSATNPRLDNSVTIYNQTTAPTFATEVLRNAAHGDIWIDTDAVVASKYWRYNSITSSWVSAPDLVTVFADLALKGNVTYRTISTGVGSTAGNPITGVAPSDFTNVTEVGGFFGSTGGTKAGDTLLVTYWYKKGTADAKLVTDMYLWNGSGWGVAGVSAAAKSKWAIDQEIELAGLGVDITATNGLVTALDGKIDDTKASVQSKFAYNSQLKIGPYAYNTGFGLDTTGSTQLGTAVVDGETLPLWSSKFWIKADEFKMVAANQTAPAQSPFEVNATTGDITFRGKVSFSNIVDAEKPSSNLLSNSAPALGSETAMWEQGFYTTSPAPRGIGAGFDVWRPTGTGSVFNSVSGAPAVGSVFDINQIGTVAVIGGSRYEATSLLSAHRCSSYCNIIWYSVAGAYIGESIAGSVNAGRSHSGALSNWVRYGGFVTAPLNAAFCRFTVRSSVTSTDPYCFVAQAYFGRATATQTVFSDWVEGAGISGAGVATAINTNTATIDGSKITVGSIAADRIDTSLLTLGGLGTSYARVSKDGIQVVVNGVTRVKLGLL